jgi:hypothetical protein
MSDDPVRNAAVRKCLVQLMTLKRDLSVKQLNREQFPADKFAHLSLVLRKNIEQELRAEGTVSDFDPLALGAFQEALREAVVRKGPGLQVPVEKVAERLQEIDVADLWHLFVKHYLGNIFEWQATAAGVDEEVGAENAPEVIALLRKEYGEEVSRKIQNRLKAQPSHKWRDVDSFLDVFEAVAAEEAD